MTPALVYPSRVLNICRNTSLKPNRIHEILDRFKPLHPLAPKLKSRNIINPRLDPRPPPMLSRHPRPKLDEARFRVPIQPLALVHLLPPRLALRRARRAAED